MRQEQLLGVASDPFPTDLMTKVAHVCAQEEYEICRDQHVIHRIITVILGFERQRQLLGADDGSELDFELGLAKKCLTFELVLTSKAKLTQQNIKVKSDVESTVQLTLDPQSLLAGTPHITGSSALKNTAFAYSIIGPTNGCWFKNHRGGSTLKITDLTWTADQAVEQQLGQVTDFALTFDPGTTTESADLQVP